MLLDRKAVALGALLVASAIGGTLALASGCTVLTNDAPPDDAGLFEGGDALTSSCDVCLSAYCTAPQALCLTNAACVGVLAAPDSACSAEGDGGVSPERLYHAYTACNDAKLETCANDCAALNRASSTLPACAAPDDGGVTDAGDAGDADAEAADAAAPDASDTDAGEPPPGPDACVACAAANCSAAVSACASGTECGQFLACSSACKTPSCVDDCAAQRATGKVAASELATCTASNCQKSCEL
jgi:hypothetical protein